MGTACSRRRRPDRTALSPCSAINVAVPEAGVASAPRALGSAQRARRAARRARTAECAERELGVLVRAREGAARKLGERGYVPERGLLASHGACARRVPHLC